jgi:transposase
MSQTPHHTESTGGGAVLYMAMELSARRWQLAFGLGLATPSRRRTMAAGDESGLRAEIAAACERFGLPSTTEVRSCYEAGRDGFWVHRLLMAEGVSNTVVDAASIEVPRRARHVKTDRLDATRLWRLLVRVTQGEQGVWRPVRVPSEADEAARHLSRSLATEVAACTQGRNRIHGLLATQGVRLPIRARFRADVAAVRRWDGAPLPAALVARLQREWRTLVLHRAHIRALEREQRAALRARQTTVATQVAQLTQLRGLGMRAMWVYVTELYAWRALTHRRQVGGLLGLTPTPYASGATQREQGISRAGNRHVRRVAVEVAWLWVRHQPRSALTQWYQARFGPGGGRSRRIGIVAVARKLAIALWRYLTTGVVPAGAVVRG